ncbi:MAG TPA: hypothetical protein VFB67_08550 [Candidatus Polarisedimenticolaceae bacterium]|nr:hypothetical protein [Candidatus Polarisedimenticolaceae bacterium]
MRRLILICAVIAFSTPVFATDTVFGYVYVRTDSDHRIQVVVDGADPEYYDAYLFQPKGKVPPIPGMTYHATVAKSDGRLTIDCQSPPIHLDLYLPVSNEVPVVAGTFPTLRCNGLGLRAFKAPREIGSMQAISMDGVGDMLGMFDPSLITCLGGKVSKDSECMVGGPGSLYSPGFKCPGRNASSPIMGFTGSTGEAEKQECAQGYYGCGYCSGAPDLVFAKQECRPYECTTKPVPKLPQPDPGP